MRDIIIKNFRCYKEKSIEFRNGINLLIGDNAVGKTSLLRACNLVINSFFSGYSDENTIWKSADNDDFRSTGITEEPVEIMFHLSDQDIEQQFITHFDVEDRQSLNQELKIEKRSKKNSRNLITGLIPFREYASRLQKESHSMLKGKIHQSYVLPLYACFTTEDIHAVRKFDKQKFKKLNQKPSFGYYECFDSKGLLDCWLNRLLVLKEAKTGEEEIASVRHAVKEALGYDGCNIIDDMDIRHNDGNVYFVFQDGRESKASLLSDGYRRLVNIVIDLAFRCALLNKAKCGETCYKETYGTVIIDEIDEHLHPALQLRVLKSLQRTFPKLQFIISTHSPLVISSVEKRSDNVVYKLEYDQEMALYSHRELDVYGMDATTIIEAFMAQSARDISISNSMKRIQMLIDENKLNEARKALSELEENMSSGDPELSRIGALISFLEE